MGHNQLDPFDYHIHYDCAVVVFVAIIIIFLVVQALHDFNTIFIYIRSYTREYVEDFMNLTGYGGQLGRRLRYG